jgi:hypothetical protein
MDAGKITVEQVQQMQKDGYIVTNITDKKEDESEVLCKMAIKGKCSKLRTLVDSILGTYYANSYNANNKYYPEVNPQLKVTLMIEKVKESE